MTIQAHTIGNKYQEVENLDIKDIAKKIRNNLKKFNDCKFNVSISRFANGQSLRVILKSSSNLNNFVLVQYESSPNNTKPSLKMSKRLKNEIKSIVDQYNFDDSDYQSDYHHVNFFSHIGIDYKFEQSIENKINKVMPIMEYNEKQQ